MLYPTLEEALGHTEWWWIEEIPEARIYTEDFVKYRLVRTEAELKRSSYATPILDVVAVDSGQPVQDELFQYFLDWRAGVSNDRIRAKLEGLIPSQRTFFDELQRSVGFIS